jgi:hypothetical protein
MLDSHNPAMFQTTNQIVFVKSSGYPIVANPPCLVDEVHILKDPADGSIAPSCLPIFLAFYLILSIFLSLYLHVFYLSI